MKSWPQVSLPSIKPPKAPLSIYSTESQRLQIFPIKNFYQIYVCGITPYDATHLGHAATYLTFDIVNRYWRALGAEVNYIQNITDIDDPLLERASRDEVDWKDLAHSQIELFRSDMQALKVIPPQHYQGVVESMADVVEVIEKLNMTGSVYSVENDKYFQVASDLKFGSESHLSRSEMLPIFAERGGDPDRQGKRDPLDALLWLSEKDGDPSWPSSFGAGRPGWHIECAAIALKFAKENGDVILDIQGGGSDLIFPHHEMSASQVRKLTGKEFARAYVHAGLIGLDGEKMSKSKGNLVFVSKLIAQGVDPMAIRWALLKRHYQSDYMWTGQEPALAEEELNRLKKKLTQVSVPPTEPLIEKIYSAIANNLSTQIAIEELNNWSESEGKGGDANQLRNVIDALLGITLPA